MAELDRVVRQVISQKQPVLETGVAVSVVKDGGVWFTNGYGYRDRAQRTPVSPDTTFGLGSLTKPFTALAWAFHEETAPLLDIPISSYEADFQLKDAEVAAKIAVRDLLAQRTGLPRHDVLWYLGDYPTAELVRRLRYLDPARLALFRGPGRYNNLMYTAAGWLLERITHLTWKEFVQTRILDPIGMQKTTFTIADLKAASEYAAPYLQNKAMCPKDVSSIAPAGALNSTAKDVALWVEFLLREGTLKDGRRLLPVLRIREQFEPVTPIDWRGVKQYYALGWFVTDVDGHRIVHHTGATDGYSTIVAMVPQEMLGVCVLVNQHASLLPDRIACGVIDALLDLSIPALCGAGPADMLGLGRLANTLLPSRPISLEFRGGGDDGFTGTYSDPGYGDMVISSDSNGRWLQWCANRWALRRLPPWVLPFFAFWVEGYGRKQLVPIWIRREDDGGRSFSLPLEPDIAPIRFYRP